MARKIFRSEVCENLKIKIQHVIQTDLCFRRNACEKHCIFQIRLFRELQGGRGREETQIFQNDSRRSLIHVPGSYGICIDIYVN